MAPNPLAPVTKGNVAAGDASVYVVPLITATSGIAGRTGALFYSVTVSVAKAATSSGSVPASPLSGIFNLRAASVGWV